MVCNGSSRWVQGSVKTFVEEDKVLRHTGPVRAFAFALAFGAFACPAHSFAQVTSALGSAATGADGSQVGVPPQGRPQPPLRTRLPDRLHARRSPQLITNNPHQTRARVPAQIVFFDRRQHRIQSDGMLALTGWSLINIITGIAGNITTDRGDPWRYAYQMNALWNTVNLTIGSIGIASALRNRSQVGHRRGVRAKVSKIQRIFAINALLDVAYMLGGTLTWELGKDRQSPRLIGYGASVIAQGAFLMVFDLSMIDAHERNFRRSLPNYSIAASPTGSGATLHLRGSF